MKRLLMDLLICPSCLPEEVKLACHIRDEERDDVLEGLFQCGHCGACYPIHKGIAQLVPGYHRDTGAKPSKYEDSAVLSSYLWSHYGDLMKDREAGAAYSDWMGLMGPSPGLGLDAGCAVGRFTFELSRYSDLVVGIDTSRTFIHAARELMMNRQTVVTLTVEGHITEQRVIRLPEAWDKRKVEFMVGDAQALPFASGSFSSLTSLNLIDRLPLPIRHMKEINRVARSQGAQFLFSDPFSWSPDIAEESNWLGGREEGPYAGMGIHNVLSLLAGAGGEIQPPWEIEKQGQTWWKIRNHRNHFELIRSCYIKARR